jgi:hypothetical protein
VGLDIDEFGELFAPHEQVVELGHWNFRHFPKAAS